MLEGALDVGIDTLDLADIYGDHTTNPLVGDALALRPGLRQRLRLLAKVGIVKTDSPGNPRGVQHYDLSVRHLRDALDASLRDLRTDHVDVLMLHRFDPLLEPAAIADWVREEQMRRDASARSASPTSAAHALGLFDGKLDIVAQPGRTVAGQQRGDRGRLRWTPPARVAPRCRRGRRWAVARCCSHRRH